MAVAARGADVVAVDFSPGMVAYTAARAAKAKLSNLQAWVGDGQALDLPDASFDIVLSNFAVMNFTDFRAGLAEMRRVLRPGGSIRVTTSAHPTPSATRPWLPTKSTVGR